MKTLRLHYITTSLVYYTDVVHFSDFIRQEIHAGEENGKKKKTKKFKQPLSNFEGWGPTEVGYKKKKCIALGYKIYHLTYTNAHVYT